MARWAFLVLLLAPLASADLEVMAQWGLLDFAAPFNFPGSDGASAASWVFTGFEVGWDKIYLSIPRFQPGLPATVGWIPRPSAGGRAESPKIQVSFAVRLLGPELGAVPAHRAPRTTP